jgi:hypothetical protein
MEVSFKFHTYFSGRLKQNIHEEWGTESPPGYLDKRWTNNNSESLNHALKRAIDWKSQPVLELVNIVKNLGFSLPEKYVWNLNETSIDFDSMSSHFTSKQMASSAFISPSCPKMPSISDSDRLTPLPQTLREYGSDANSGLICGG